MRRWAGMDGKSGVPVSSGFEVMCGATLALLYTPTAIPC